MRQKQILILGFLILACGLIAGYFIYSSQFNKSYSQMSESEIQEKFDCNRVTEDVLETDIYCQFPGLYKNGDITDAELNKGLGCDNKEDIENKDHPCVNSQKYIEYKEWLLKEDKKLKEEGCVNVCPLNN